MSSPTDPFAPIDPAALEKVAGGASRASSSNDQISQVLTQITSSIKDLASQKNSSSDPMQMMLIMLMMGGMGGGGGVVAAPAAGHAQPVINVDTAVAGGGRGGGCGKRGKKGW